MPATDPWTCPACRQRIESAFCPRCGEQPIRARELTLRGLLEQLFHAFTSIDGRLLRSLRSLLLRPGELTQAWVQGRRLAYLGPVPLFLMANVLFFATESLVGGSVFTTPLD